MNPAVIVIAKAILAALITNREFIAQLILNAQEMAADAPGESRFKVVAAWIAALYEESRHRLCD